MKRRITIDLKIDLNGTREYYIDGLLDYAVRHLFSNGMFTGNSEAEVALWSYNVDDPYELR